MATNLSLKKSLFPVWAWVLVVIFGIILLAILWLVGVYNGLISSQGSVQNSWAQVETEYQRRADLVPQLVSTVEGAADFEKSTLLEVTSARTAWMNTQDSGASIEDQMAAGSSFDSAFSRLLVTVESYPTLTATDTFKTLQAQLEGNENRISVARMDYNAVATTYNVKIRRIPTNLFAAMFGFDEFPLFASDAGSETAPKVEFDF